ncbi:MAG: 50S ribosomal protein L31 [Elusimicrobiota bacterium]
MKTGIHPSYYNTQVTCACGNSFMTRSTKKEIKLDVCAGCHPFYTGKQRLMDTAGRVERFRKRFLATEGKTVERAPKAEVKMKKLEAVMSRKIVRKTLSTAPIADDKKKGAKKLSSAPKDAKKAA